jgi:hypothetical protein
MSQKLKYNGINLTPEYGAIFVETILGNAEAFFSAEIVDLEEDMETKVLNEKLKDIAKKEDKLSL